MEQKANESDSDEELKTESSRLHHRRKHNSFSVSSERSESVISSSRYNRFKDFRSGSKASGSNSNPQRNLSPSPSRLTTTSSITDHSAPIGFDMSNRAKLPKGIDNIRPHLENVDNVPLLVSLFTDCTPDATKEMIKIMQEYDEVVCVIGSMANESNMPIFLQADARFDAISYVDLQYLPNFLTALESNQCILMFVQENQFSLLIVFHSTIH